MGQSETNAFADRVFVGEMLAREGSIDDGYRLRLSIVLRSEPAATFERMPSARK